jgi:hypothetical protein
MYFGEEYRRLNVEYRIWDAGREEEGVGRQEFGVGSRKGRKVRKK